MTPQLECTPVINMMWFFAVCLPFVEGERRHSFVFSLFGCDMKVPLQALSWGWQCQQRGMLTACKLQLHPEKIPGRSTCPEHFTWNGQHHKQALQTGCQSNFPYHNSRSIHSYLWLKSSKSKSYTIPRERIGTLSY